MLSPAPFALILIGETLRHALEVLAEVAPDWLWGQIRPEWAECYGRRYDEISLPKEAPARQTLAAEIGGDSYVLLEALHAPAALPWLRLVPAVQTLRRVWVQQYYRDAEGTPHWRTEGGHGVAVGGVRSCPPRPRLHARPAPSSAPSGSSSARRIQPSLRGIDSSTFCVGPCLSSAYPSSWPLAIAGSGVAGVAGVAGTQGTTGSGVTGSGVAGLVTGVGGRLHGHTLKTTVPT